METVTATAAAESVKKFESGVVDESASAAPSKESLVPPGVFRAGDLRQIRPDPSRGPVIIAAAAVINLLDSSSKSLGSDDKDCRAGVESDERDEVVLAARQGRGSDQIIVTATMGRGGIGATSYP